MVDADAIHIEEDDGCEHPSSFLVPVDEQVVLDDVEKVGRCHREQAVVGELATE